MSLCCPEIVIHEQADYFERMADQLERDPILALDYLKRAFLINGDNNLKRNARKVVKGAGLDERAANSVEQIAAVF